MQVRALDTSDAPVYRTLMLQGYAQDADAFTTTAEERSAEPMAWWHKRICDPDGRSQAFGAFHNGALVGGVAIEYSSRFKTRHKALLVGMFVSALHRRLGAGRALLAAALAHARSRPEVKLVTLTVSDGNVEALRLYGSAGFQPFGLEPMAIFTGARYVSKVHMQMKLSAP